MRVFLLLIAVCGILATFAFSQTENNTPSKAEISELVSKANQKVLVFEQTVKDAKPFLDRGDPQLFANYLDAATAAHTIMQTLQKNGPSAEGLVLLLATLDDLSLDAANASIQLLNVDEANVAKGQQPNMKALGVVVLLNAAGTACNDVAELIMHATIRLIRAEEAIIRKLPHGSK